jgi:hypothetical protein
MSLNRVHKSLPLSPVLNQINSVHIIPSFFLKIHFNIIFPFTHYMSCSSHDPWFLPLFSMNLSYGGSLRSIFQVSCQSSVAWVVPKNPSKSEVYVTFLNILILYGEELLAPCPALKWMTISCRPSATACSYIPSYPSYMQAVFFIRSKELDNWRSKKFRGTAHGSIYLCLYLLSF